MLMKQPSIRRWPSGPTTLVVYGGHRPGGRGAGRRSTRFVASAAGGWPTDETLLVQSGKPVARVSARTRLSAPRVPDLEQAMLVPRWADWDTFPRAWSAPGLTMYGQMTAGFLDLHIGTPGHPAGHVRDARRAGPDQRFRRQPARARRADQPGWAAWAAPSRWRSTMNGGVALVRRGGTGPAHRAGGWRRGYLDPRHTADLDEAVAWVEEARGGRAAAVGRAGRANAAADVHGELGAARLPGPTRVNRPDVGPTDPLGGVILPVDLTLEEARRAARSASPRRVTCASSRAARWRTHVRADARVPGRPAPWVFDYGNKPAPGGRWEGGCERALRVTPGFVPAFVRPMFCEGKGPFRWVALSGDPADIAGDGPRRHGPVPRRRSGLHRWLRMAEERVAFQGLPARICWLGYGQRAAGRPGVQPPGSPRAGSARPIVDSAATHLDAGQALASPPPRERRAWRTASDAIADWPNAERGWSTRPARSPLGVPSITGGGGGHRLLASTRGMVVVADGSEQGGGAGLERVLTLRPPASGSCAHADCGAYELALRRRPLAAASACRWRTA